MGKYSREWWSEIECQPGCANCCPKDNKCGHLQSNGTCDVHPEVLRVSTEEAYLLGRPLACSLVKPIKLFKDGIYCPAIVSEVEKYLGESIGHHSGKRGEECVDNHKEVLEKAKKILPK